MRATAKGSQLPKKSITFELKVIDSAEFPLLGTSSRGSFGNRFFGTHLCNRISKLLDIDLSTHLPSSAMTPTMVFLSREQFYMAGFAVFQLQYEGPNSRTSRLYFHVSSQHVSAGLTLLSDVYPEPFCMGPYCSSVYSLFDA